MIQADVIHVVEHGAIVESGSHAELLARAGRYAHFYRLHLSRGADAKSQDEVSMIAS
jgi:ABC-type multidrug transport system fused ATPase/permease subunit